MKTCRTCSLERGDADFYPKKTECKQCTKERALRRYHANKEECIQRTRDWQAANPEKHRAYAGKKDAMRRAGVECIPKGFTVASTFPVYAEAIAKETATGIPHHVDHIVPLTAGGMHCPSNLQVLTATDNIMKGSSV